MAGMNRSQALGKSLRAKNPSMPEREVKAIEGIQARRKNQAPGQSDYKPGGRPARKKG